MNSIFPCTAPGYKRFQGYTCDFTNIELSTDTMKSNLKNIYRYQSCLMNNALS